MVAIADLQHQLGTIEDLLRKVESADPALRATVQDLVEAIMSLHGAGLERVLELLRASGDGGEAAIAKLGGDQLVSSLLVLYGLHPLTIEARVTKALDKLASRLLPQGADAVLLGVEDGVVRVRLHAKDQGCGASSLRALVEEAVYQAAADLISLQIEGAEERRSFVPIEMLLTDQPMAKGVS
jgi:hypothetical protein